MKDVMTGPPKHEDNGPIDERLGNWAHSLAARSGGLLRAVENTRPEDQPYQDLNEFYYPSVLPDVNEPIAEHSQRLYTKYHNWLLNEASRLFPNFYQVAVCIRNNGDLLEDIRQQVQNKANIAVVTNHPSLMSPIIDQIEIDTAFSDITISQRMDIVANKALGWLTFPVSREHETAQPHDMNCLDIATKIADVYCCIPDSDSSEFYGLGDYSNELNGKMLRGFKRNLKRGGRIVTFAGSGSLDLMPTTENPAITMKQASPVTARLIGESFDYGIFVVSWSNHAGELDIIMSDSLVPLENSKDVHDLMRQMEQPYYKLVNGTAELGGIPVHYDYPAAA